MYQIFPILVVLYSVHIFVKIVHVPAIVGWSNNIITVPTSISPRTYRTLLDACVRQWGQVITKNLRGETDKYTGVGGSTQLDFINITISSNRVMGYVYICIHTVKVRIKTICICNHFPPAPYKQYCPTIVIVYVCPQRYANDST